MDEGEKLIAQLSGVDHMSVEDCFMQSPLFSKAAARLTALDQENKRLREALKKLVSLYEAEFDPEVANRRPDWLCAALTHEDKT